MEVSGKVKVIGVEQQVSSAFTKRELVIVTDEQYPQTISIEFPQGKCNNELDTLLIGKTVKVSINLGGREWVNPQGETKYFNSIKGWKIEKANPSFAPQNNSAPATAQPIPAIPITDEEQDDLPF
jgi:hypothetical protein